MSQERFQQRYEDALSASERLIEIVQKPESEIIRDATIHRFEFTFEAVWKALQIYLKHEGFEVNSPRDVIRKAFQARIILTAEASDAWLNMLEDRNLTTHIYRRPLAKEIYDRVVSLHAERLRAMAEKLPTLPWS